jgi:hypothetical protein
MAGTLAVGLKCVGIGGSCRVTKPSSREIAKTCADFTKGVQAALQSSAKGKKFATI